MVIGYNMTNQNYLIIENNVVTNIVLWNGDNTAWQPPVGSIQLVQATTPARIWLPVLVDKKIVDWALTPVEGNGNIGFIWDGSILSTTEPKPPIPVE
jgi:hypothetical protein